MTDLKSSLKVAAAQLRRVLADPLAIGGAPYTALDALADLAESRNIVALVNAVLRNDAHMIRHAKVSYTHPLGFEKIVLIDAEPEFALRLHVWWPTAQVEIEHVHNHRFGFASVMVAGHYDMSTFALSSAGEQATEYRENVQRMPLGWQLDRMGDARLAVVAHCRFGQGSSYALSAETLHQVIVPPGRLCITLFLETSVAATTTSVFGPAGHREIHVRTKAPMTAESYRTQLRAVLAALGG